jgi:hypothetical protein
MAQYVAQKFIAPSPDAQTIGSSLILYLRNLRSEEIASILAKYGLSSIEPNEWYPMQRALDIQRDIYETNENVSEKMVAVGIQFAQDQSFPPETKTVTDVLLTRMGDRSSRNVPAGFGRSPCMVSEKHAWVFHNSPYSDDAVYGFLWGLVNRFKPKNDMFVVRIIENPDPENHPGTCFDIKWGATWDEVE